MNSNYFGRIQNRFKKYLLFETNLDALWNLKIFSGGSTPKTPPEGFRAPTRPPASADTYICFSTDYVYSWDHVCSIYSGNFSVRGYFPLILKDSITHIHGLAVYVKEGLPFAQDVS